MMIILSHGNSDGEEYSGDEDYEKDMKSNHSEFFDGDEEKELIPPIISQNISQTNSPPSKNEDSMFYGGVVSFFIFLLVMLFVNQITDPQGFSFTCNQTNLMLPKIQFDKLSTNVSIYEKNIEAMEITMALKAKFRGCLFETLTTLKSEYQDLKKTYDYEQAMLRKCDLYKILEFKKAAFIRFAFLRKVFVPIVIILVFISTGFFIREQKNATGKAQYVERAFFCGTFIANMAFIYLLFTDEQLWQFGDSNREMRRQELLLLQPSS